MGSISKVRARWNVSRIVEVKWNRYRSSRTRRVSVHAHPVQFVDNQIATLDVQPNKREKCTESIDASPGARRRKLRLASTSHTAALEDL